LTWLLALAAMAGGARAAQEPAAPVANPCLRIVSVPGISGSSLTFSSGAVCWLDSNSLLYGTPARGRLSPDGHDAGVEIMRPRELLDAVRLTLPPSAMAMLGQRGLVPTDKRLHSLPISMPFPEWARATFGDQVVFVASYDWRKGAGPDASDRIDTLIGG
jgi:hypothetical protein